MDVSTYISPVIAVLALALTQAVKGVVPDEGKKYMPLCALLVGVVAAVVTSAAGITNSNVIEVITTGAVSGLAGCGVFELGKQLLPGKEE